MDIWDFLSNDQAKWTPRRSRPHVRWSLPSGKNPFKSHRFWAPRRPGVAPLRDPVPKILPFFWKVFRTRLFKTKICKITQEWLFWQRKKSALTRSYMVRGMGPPPGTRFCMYSYHTKQNKKAKTKKPQVLSGILISNKHFCARCENTKCFIVISVLNKTCVFVSFCFFVLFIVVTVHAKAGPWGGPIPRTL